MDGLEEQLKRALARQDPSAGFADRITAAARPGAGPGLRAVPAAPFAPRWWLATAAMALVKKYGMRAFCRALLNSSEMIYVN